MVNFINEQKAAKTEPAGEQTQELSPQQKAARTRARNKAKKEAAAKAAA
ncbi:MAG: phage capsid protein, partial [Gammaproteobacteria bacterium]